MPTEKIDSVTVENNNGVEIGTLVIVDSFKHKADKNKDIVVTAGIHVLTSLPFSLFSRRLHMTSCFLLFIA